MIYEKGNASDTFGRPQGQRKRGFNQFEASFSFHAFFVLVLTWCLHHPQYNLTSSSEIHEGCLGSSCEHG